MAKLSWSQRTVISVNVPYEIEISPAELAEALTNSDMYVKWRHHVWNFFSDVTKNCMVGFLAENKLSVADIMPIFTKCQSMSSGNFEQIIMEQL